MSELRLEPAEDLDALRDDWTRLGEQSGNVFTTWEWASIWWRHYGRGRHLQLSVCRDGGGAAVAILPLHLATTRPIRILRLLGCDQADELGPVCAAESREAAAGALRHVLDAGDWNVFLGDHFPGTEPWAELLAGRVVDRTSSPVLSLAEASWDEFLAARSQNLRQQVRRFERRLAGAHELRYRLSNDPALLERDLDTLFALHRARWSGSPWFSDEEAFHREFAASALERGWLRLWLLELDGAPAAAWLGFRFAGIESYYQAGRDPAFERESVGFVLLAHTIREALQDGMSEYRFLRGGEAYKYRFVTADPGLVTVARAKGVVGTAALAARRLRRRLRRLG
jgi:CelD/BcsL family acetyltransferase involved in cellulose biosynthesis